MRINQRVFTEKMDMLGGIPIPNCPTQFRKIAENIVSLLTKPDFSIGEYHTMTELDKKLMWAYWREYDMRNDAIDGFVKLEFWFVQHATSPELIRRARQYLVEHNWVLINPDVAERAYEAGNKFSRSIKQ